MRRSRSPTDLRFLISGSRKEKQNHCTDCDEQCHTGDCVEASGGIIDEGKSGRIVLGSLTSARSFDDEQFDDSNNYNGRETSPGIGEEQPQTSTPSDLREHLNKIRAQKSRLIKERSPFKDSLVADAPSSSNDHSRDSHTPSRRRIEYDTCLGQGKKEFTRCSRSPHCNRLSQSESRQAKEMCRAHVEGLLSDDPIEATSSGNSDSRTSSQVHHNNAGRAQSHDNRQFCHSGSYDGLQPVRLAGAKRPRDPSPSGSETTGDTSAKKSRLANKEVPIKEIETFISVARGDARSQIRTSAAPRQAAVSSRAHRQPPTAVAVSSVPSSLRPIGYEALSRKRNAEPRDLLQELYDDTSPIRPRLIDGRLHETQPELIDPLLHVVNRALQCTAYPQLAENVCRFLSRCELFSAVVHKALVGKKLGSSPNLTTGNRTDRGAGGAAVWSTLVVYLKIAERVLAVTAEAWRGVRLVLQELRDQMSEWSAAGWQQQPDDEKLVQRVSEAVAQAREGTYWRGGECQPVDGDFRLISIFPVAEELQLQQPVLLPNLPRGAFDDCEHYLGVQYRLLREDFMVPLRDGVSMYLERLRLGQPIGRLQGVRIYRRITINRAVSTPTGVNYCLRFCEANQRRLAKKQFLSGSLLLLSANDFKTFYVATVERHGDRNGDQDRVEENSDQEKALPDLQVKFEGASAADILAVDFGDTEFVMLETTAYFESYRHVLEGLNCLNKDNLKFEQYLVRGSSSGRVLPAYLKDNSPVYNLECIATAQARYKQKSKLKDVAVKSDASWPSAHDLGLDNSQFTAFKLALTSDLAVIQGPPGTGKTYIGLKIAEALLANRISEANIIDKAVSNNNQKHKLRSTPLLIVCYTNHALDQFLEGLFRYGRRVVRLGGRSKSDMLRPCNISNLRERHTKSIIDARNRLEERSHAVAHLINQQQSLRRRIVNYSFLEEFILPSHAAQIVPPIEEEEGELLSEEEEDAEQKLSNDELLWLWLDPESANYMAATEDGQQHTEKLKLILASEPCTTEDEQQVQSIWDLEPRHRWQLYAKWICRYSDRLRNDLPTAVNQQAEAARELEELRAFEDVNILRGAEVIGMTTTGAAKNRKLLQDVQPRIIIVEEAAQVLEGHVVTMLGAGCDHLILIGDHQQLRPSVNVHELAKKYHLDVSLFERMVHNGMPFCTLTTQHRMRLEISAVMRQFYPHLEDDDGVKNRESVKGMKFNMFYISHNEAENKDEHNASYSNQHEAAFLVALCQYLLKQGFAPSQITILTPYNGQVCLLQQLIKKSKCENVIVTSIDNYQGEENDLILLSTVRSNKIGDTGFTSIPNRICVMLSRARLGLYAIGDFEMLRKRSKMWKGIIDHVEKGGMLGQKLPLMCKHHNHVTVVDKASDFDQIRGGGCAFPCDSRLECGHKCSKTCHDDADDHSATRCKKPCVRDIKSCGHCCTKLCYEDCVPCQVPITRTLSCGHEKSAPCGQHLGYIVCDRPCERLLACGHRCINRCGDACANNCLVKVERQYSCGHTNQVLCHQNEISAPCQVPCTTLLACSHPCSGNCGSCSQGRLHKTCTKVCGRLLVCGHKCPRECCNGCLPCPKLCKNRCIHSRCQKTCGDLCTPCREACTWQCEHYRCTRLCFEPCDRPPCDRPCKKDVRCRRCRRKSSCVGLCGEPCPVVCDYCKPTRPHRELFFGEEAEDSARFVQLEDCGHVVESTGMDRWIKLISCVTDQRGDQDNDRVDGVNEQQSALSIQVICCPMCKTPVRRCVRYSTFVNARQADIEKVKSKILDSTRSTNATWNEQCISRLPPRFNNDLRSINDDQIVRFKQECLRKIELLIAKQSFKTDLLKVERFVRSLKDVLRKQEVDDVQTELTRIDYRVRIMVALRAYGSSPSAPTEHGDMLRSASEIASSAGKLDDEKKTRLELYYSVIDKYAVPISQAEKEMILKAMDFTHKGHWYKCPNGHIYCIGECGGAMEVGTCPDCKCSIGGTSHRLNEDNSLASEMDGASRPAYSELNLPDLALLP